MALLVQCRLARAVRRGLCTASIDSMNKARACLPTRGSRSQRHAWVSLSTLLSRQELAAVFGGALQPDVAVDARAGLAASAVQGAAAAAAPPVALTHVDSEGKLHMVDVGSKPHTRVRGGGRAPRVRAPDPQLQRTASASARVLLGPEAFQQVAENRLKKACAAACVPRRARLTTATPHTTPAHRATCWSSRSWPASVAPS